MGTYQALKVLRCYTNKYDGSKAALPLRGIFYTATRHTPSPRNLVVAAHARPTDASPQVR